jgi:hypothetical protein
MYVIGELRGFDSGADYLTPDTAGAAARSITIGNSTDPSFDR